MKILFVASEVTPFAKTGGLADVIGSLPAALRQRGHDVRIIIPLYRAVKAVTGRVRRTRRSCDILLDGATRRAHLRIGDLEGAPVYFIEQDELFDREYCYGPPHSDYPDNPRRFAFFCRAALDLVKRLDFRPDIIHCHDWQTALIPLLLRHDLKDDPFYATAATIFTIHNLAYQGLFPVESLRDMGLDQALFTVSQLEFYGKVSLLKGGIVNADVITTVSPTYCREILTPEQGCGLDGVLAQRRSDLYGMVNGLDITTWDPETDGNLATTYSATALAGKKLVKRALRKELDLEHGDGPLLGMVSRVVSQKGFDLIIELLPRFEAADVDLVILGSGDESYLRTLIDAAKRCRCIKICTGSFNDPLAHRIYAGSDIFLMPSRSEPCGLSQLIALRYGAVPVVRRTGGLADTVTDVSQRDGTGFVFDEFSASALWEAIQRALAMYAVPEQWKKLVRRGMRKDVSWDTSAQRYEELYHAAMARRRR